MGSRGVKVRNRILDLIHREDLRSEITLTPTTRATGDFGGYEPGTSTSGTSRTVYAIPSSYAKNLVNQQKFGDLQEGDVRLLIAYDEVFDSDDIATFEGQDYYIRLTGQIFFNEEVIAQSLTLSKKK